MVTGLFFLLAVLFAPLFLMIPTAATTPVLLIIGFVMMQGLKSIDFGIEEWVPVGMLIISTLFYGDIFRALASASDLLWCEECVLPVYG